MDEHAYDCGYSAFCFRADSEENPFEPGTDDYEAWRAGWYDAAAHGLAIHLRKVNQ